MNPNAMAAWDEIGCQRGHREHRSKYVQVKLDGPTAYGDCTSIPHRLAVGFGMKVWDTDEHPVDGGPYCPAHDVVSQTISELGVWEPRETVLVLDALAKSHSDTVLLDIGAQVGWYSHLAIAMGRKAVAWEADHDCAELLRSLNYPDDVLEIHEDRVGPFSELLRPARRVSVAKIDIEGAEWDAIDALWPHIAAGAVDHLLVEISPVFDDWYPRLVCRLVDAGYAAYMLPPKTHPPYEIGEGLLPRELASWRIDLLHRSDLAALVAGWHQEDVWFVRGR